ncbi:MAG: hypothetical protein KDD89_10675, partial [Anaerolineales bacterium]|nr:hypothetical protein [Anaerolineales bacterium]
FTGIINGTNNLSTNANGCSSLDALGAPTGLGSLADNGGATPTHALQNNSNAIDLADTCPASGTDQRGETRNDLACDIGAFELVFADDATVSRTTGNTPAELPGSFGPTLVSITAVNSGDPGTIVITKTTEAPGGGVPSADELPVTWFISATGGSYDVDMRLCYTDAELGTVSEAGLLAYRWDAGLSMWQLGGAFSFVDAVNNCVVVNGVTEFSAWTVAANTPSAVTLAHTAAESQPISPPWLLVGLLVLFTAVGLRLHRQQV